MILTDEGHACSKCGEGVLHFFSNGETCIWCLREEAEREQTDEENHDMTDFEKWVVSGQCDDDMAGETDPQELKERAFHIVSGERCFCADCGTLCDKWHDETEPLSIFADCPTCELMQVGEEIESLDEITSCNPRS